MQRTLRSVVGLGTLTLVLAVFAVPATASAQSGNGLEAVMGHPFTSDLIASPTGSRIAWIVTQRGIRNIWVADGPDFEARPVTQYDRDDGQELTNLSFAPDGQRLVYVRGGDHGSNWSAAGNLRPNPESLPVAARMSIWSVDLDSGEPVEIGEGDIPAVSPDGERLAFVKGREMWVAPLDGDAEPARMFFERGASESPRWSPDGRTLAFGSDRDAHSYIALYEGSDAPLRYLAPSTSRDSMPRWSPDGSQIAFVRRPGAGGSQSDPLELQSAPWSIWVADVASGTAREVYASPETLVGSYPRVMNGANLAWGAGDRLVFVSYEDGWPHLYSVPAAGGQPLLLTPGDFMVEHVALSPDRSTVVYSANAGDALDDIDRRHVWTVPVDAARPVALTSGEGIEWAPVVTADGQTVALISSDAERPGLTAVTPLAGGDPRLLSPELIENFPTSQLVTPQTVALEAPDGTTIHAQLFKATFDQDAARRPAIVFVHGGPMRQMLLGWHYMYYYANTYALNQYLASRGHIVISVNYRLGIGYGHAFHFPEAAGTRGASEYQDVLAAGRYLATRDDVDPDRIGIWGGSYGGYLTALALGRNSDVFAAGVDIHGVHNRVRQPSAEQLAAAIVGDGITEAELERAVRVAWESSPVSTVETWRSPVLFVHGDDDRNVQVQQTIDLVQRLRGRGVEYEEIVIPDDIHDFLLHRNWVRVGKATADFFGRVFQPAGTARR